MDSKLSSFGLVTALAVSLLCAQGCSSEESSPSTAADTGTAAADTGTAATDTGTTADTGGTANETGATETGGGTDAGPVATCEAYCANVMTACKLTNEQYLDVATCVKMCQKMAPGSASDTAADTIGCRNHFADLAKTAPEANCAAAGAYGGGKCAPRCDAFCKLAMAQCTGVSGASYANEAACKTTCTGMSFDETKSVISQDKGKLNCALYHLQAAYGASVPHCSHLTTTSGPCAP